MAKEKSFFFGPPHRENTHTIFSRSTYNRYGTIPIVNPQTY